MHRPCFVYVFGPLSQPCKVGIAFDVSARAQMIRCNSQKYIPHHFKTNGIMWFSLVLPDRYEAKIVERSAHGLLDSFRIIHPDFPSHRARCEWFDIEQGAAIQAIKEAEKRTRISFLAPDSWLERLEAWTQSQPVPPTKSEVIRLAVEKFIADHEGKEKRNAGKKKEPA